MLRNAREFSLGLLIVDLLEDGQPGLYMVLSDFLKITHDRYGSKRMKSLPK